MKGGHNAFYDVHNLDPERERERDVVFHNVHD